MPRLLFPMRRVCRTAVLAAVFVFPAVLEAQVDLRRADSLLRMGRLSSAESLYYRAVRRRPRDPAARLALGRYLAARGATKVGAVLIEEARFFGLPPGQAAMHLAPLYMRMDAWPSLAMLDQTLLTAGERQRASWLADNRPKVQGPDSVVMGYEPAGPTAPYEAASLGTVVVRFGRDSVFAIIDPDVQGLVLDRSRSRGDGIRLFSGGATDERQSVGVLPQAQIGALLLTNLPVSFDRLGGSRQARVGLELLARFAPSFHPRERRLVLRRSGRVPNGVRGVRLPVLFEPRSTWVFQGGRMESMGGGITRQLGSVSWTLDARRGMLLLEN